MNNDLFSLLMGKLDLAWRKKVPQILQTESSECGVASLAMVFHYFGLHIDLFNLRQQFGTSTRGATLNTLMDIASSLKFKSRALSIDIDEFSALKTPCILHWDLNHFVVLVAVRRNCIVIHDPALGRRAIGVHELSQHFTGIALELWPDSDFTPVIQQSRLQLRRLLSNISGLKGALTKIFCLSLIIEAVSLLMPVGTQLVLDHVIQASDHHLLALICTGLLFFIVFRTAVAMLRSWTTVVMDSLIDVQWKAGMFGHLMALPLTYFEKRKLGDIQSRFGSLDTIRTTFTTSMVNSIIDGIMSVGVLMLMYGGWLVWAVLGFTAVYVIMRLMTYNYYRQASEALLVKSAKASSHFMETLYGIGTLKALGLLKTRAQFWLNLNIDTTNAGIRITRLDMLFGGVNAFIAACDQVIILWLGASLVIDNQMPMGYETRLGELGGSLSGGQKQRLLIARALYRRPGILFMDEATSHLDLNNEAYINASITALDITRVIIAHRPSTIASADRVITLA